MADEFRCAAKIQRMTEKATQVLIYQGVWRGVVWVPKSILRSDCNLFKTNDEGTLVVPLWWAVEKGLVLDREIKQTRSLQTQQMIDQILEIMRLQADALQKISSQTESLCECGQCNDEDPIGWHQAEAVRHLRKLMADSLDS